MNIQKELIKYQSETTKRFSMKIPLSKLKEYVKTLEELETDELNLEIINNYIGPDYCLFISEEQKLVTVESNPIQKQSKYIDTQFSLQPVRVATLVLNTNYEE